MERATMTSAVTIRPFSVGDEANVLELLGLTLGGGPAGRRPPEFFRWKHYDNPFGRSFMLLAEADGRVIGLRAFMRWRFSAAGRQVTAVRAVDTATHPDYQGMGVFSRLTRAALEGLDGQVDLVFNTPNDASRPGYLKLGWREVGRAPVSLRVRRPVRFALGLRRPGTPRSARPAVAAEPAAGAGPGRGGRAPAGPRSGRRRAPPYPETSTTYAGATAPRRCWATPAWSRRRPAVCAAWPCSGPAPGSLWESTVAELLVADGDRRSPGGCWARSRRRRPSTTSRSAPPPGSAPPGPATCRPGGISWWSSRCATASTPTRRSWVALSLGDLEVF